MSLPGKLIIGILEEDNPLKSYFRFKPLLVEAEGSYTPYAGGDAYPEDGCIRIVPDKNEAYHFKARMRRMGLFCVVDLRAHPDDNDKIRPNKNYREGGPESNAFIIYSDVVREPAPGMILQILPESAPGDPPPRHRAPAALLKGEDLHPQRYAWESAGEDAPPRLVPTGESCPVERMQQFELAGFRDETVALAILPPSEVESAFAPPPPRPEHPAREPERPRTEPPAPERPAAPAPAARETPSEEKPEAPVPEHAEARAPEAPVAERNRPESPAPEAAGGDKPWIHRDDSMLPRPVDPRLSPAQRSLAAQSGLNPRRGRSLQELIDEKWQRSRLNQLGQPVTPIQTGAPVASPVESAVRAVRDVWNQPQLRDDLLKSLGGIEEFGASLEECREAARQSDIERTLEALEERRLSLLGELDHLSLKNERTRESLKRELRRDEDASLADAVKRTQAAREEQHKYESLAAEARAAAEDAHKALDAMTGEALERQLAEFALNGHMLERMQALRGEAKPVPPALPSLQSVDLNALAVRVMNRFDASGFAVTRFEALNLCACVALSPVLILSGPVGSGKTETARMLAEALGWTELGRVASFAPGKAPLDGDPRLDALDAQPDAPALLQLDDANLYPAPDPLRGLQTRLRPRWRLCLTIQDGGCPLSAHALDRGFTLRLMPKPTTPWRPRAKSPCPPEAPAALELPVPEAPLPAAMEARMDALREGLRRRGATLSRRTLDDAWRYCALMLSALGEAADATAILDRAVAQRLLPCLLASAPAGALAALPALLEGLPQSRALLAQPAPFELF